MKKGIILFGHGARNAAYVEPFHRIRAVVEAADDEVLVAIGFLELTQPPLEESIAGLVSRGATHIRVTPIFFAPGRHVLKDLPQQLADAMERFPDVEFEITPCVGEGEGVIAAMAQHALASN